MDPQSIPTFSLRYFTRGCWLFVFGFVLFVNPLSFAQINNYTFSQSFEPYEVLIMDSLMGSSTTDDQNFNGIRTRFPFVYNNQTYDRVSVNHNGFVVMGPVSGYSFGDACISVANASGRCLNSTNAGSTNNLVSAYNMDLQATGFSKFGIKRMGVSPNRIFIVQWNNVRRFATSGGSDTINFQIRLYETTNVIEFRYGHSVLSQNQASPLKVQIGLRGNSASEFKCRRSDDNWSATTAGTSNLDGVVFSTTVKPTPGLILRYTPLPPAQNDLAMEAVLDPQAQGEGCVLGSNEKIRVIIRNNGTLPQSSLAVGYRVNGGTPVTQTFTRPTPLPTGGRDTLTFTQGTNMSSTGTYQIVTYTLLPNELAYSRANDTLYNYTVTLTPPRNLPQPIITTLSVGQQNGWKSGKGKNKPQGNNSAWTTAFPFASESIALTSTTSQTNVQDWFYSPNLNITDNSVLIFKSALTADAFGSSPISNIGDDTIKVMASFDCGASWKVLKSFKQSDLASDSIRNSLREYRFKLTNSATATAIIAYYFTNNNTPAANVFRFHIDDIEIREIPPFDAGVIAVLRPKAASPGCVLSNQEPVSVVIRNYGSSSFSSITLGYKINGGTTTSETFTLTPPLSSGGIDTLTFSAANGANLSLPGTYFISVFTNLNGEIAITHANDTLRNYRVALSAPFPIPTPLFSNLTQVTANSWKKGRGATTPIDSVSSWFSSFAVHGIETISCLSTTSASTLREWIYSPTYNITPDAILVCKIAVARGNITALPNANMGDDTLKLMVTDNCGATWKLIRKFSQADILAGTLNDTLKRFSFPLGQYGSKVSVAFFFSNLSTPASAIYRVHVRDIQVRNPLLNNDLGVVSILAPTNNIAFCTLGTQIPVRVVVSNFGLASQTSSVVAYRTGNGPEKAITVNFSPSPLVPGAIDTVTFSGTDGADFITTGVFNLKAYTKLSNEDPGGIVNDTLTSYKVDVRAAKTGTAFLEFFDSGTAIPNGWVAETKVNPTQQFSVKPDRGYGGSNAVSVLMSTNNPTASLNSPRYRLPATLSGLRFKFRLSDNSGEATTLRGSDSIVVRYTKDCGGSFQNLIRIDSLTYVPNNQFQDTARNLEGLAGEEVMFTIQVRLTKTDSSRANFDLDNWIIEQTTAIRPEQLAGSVSIYPNPASGSLTVLAEGDRIKSVDITNLAGQEVLRKEVVSLYPQQLDISSLAPGAYLVKIQTDRTRVIKKLVVIR